MARVGYNGSEGKKAYTNNLFSKGMYYTTSPLREGYAKAIVNMDISPVGDMARTRNGLYTTTLNGQFTNRHTIHFKSRQDQDNMYLLKFNYTTTNKAYITDYIIPQEGESVTYTTRHYGNTTGSISGFQNIDTSYIAASQPSYALNATYVSMADGDSGYLQYSFKTNEFRMLGLNAPEISTNDRYASEAKTYVEDRLTNATTIAVEYEPNADKQDRYGRQLIYVWVDGSLLNYELLYHGLAKSFELDESYKYYHQLRQANIHATANGLGIYGTDTPTVPAPYVFNETAYFEVLTKEIEPITKQGIKYSNEEIQYVYIDYLDAIGVLAKVLLNDTDLYRGLLVFKVVYNTTTNQYILSAQMLEPYVTRVSEALNIGFNLLKANPFTFENYLGQDALESGYVYWDVIGLLPYSKDGKILTKAAPGIQIDYKVFVAAPPLSNPDYLGYAIKWEYRFEHDDDWTVAKDWTYILDTSGNILDGIESPFQLPAITNATGSQIMIRVSFSPYKAKEPDYDLISYRLYQPVLDDATKDLLAPNEAAANSFVVTNHPTEFNPNNKIVFKDDNNDFYFIYPRVDVNHDFDIYADIERDVYNTEMQVLKVENRTSYRFLIVKNDAIEPPTMSVELLPSKYGTIIKSDPPIWHDYPDNVFGIDTTLVRYGVLPAFNISALTTQYIKEINNTLDVTKATNIAYFLRQIIFYGDYVGDNILQFSTYEQTNYLPFPQGTVVFPEPIVHVHPHNDKLIIFGKENIYMLYDGMDPMTMKLSKIYSNLSINKFERNTVVSFGAEVFFISNLQGYVIQPNKYNANQNEVNLYPVTKEVEELLYNPKYYLDYRLKYHYYPDKTDWVDKPTIHCDIKSFVYNKKLHVFASYHYDEDKKSIMLILVYDTNTRRWYMYDTIVASFPISIQLFESNIGMQLLCANHYSETDYTLYATFHDQFKTKDILIFDIETFALTNVYELPIQVAVSSGNLDVDIFNDKRFSQLFVTINNIDGHMIPAKLDFKIDGQTRQTSKLVRVAQDATGTYQSQESITDNLIIPGETILDEWQLDLSRFPKLENIRMEFGISGKGKVPSFVLAARSEGLFELLNYGIIYKKKSI